MHIVCVSCSRFMLVERNGVVVCQWAPLGLENTLVPYQLWKADLYRCPDCGRDTVAGFGQAPIVQHHEGAFMRVLRAADEDGGLIHAYHVPLGGKA